MNRFFAGLFAWLLTSFIVWAAIILLPFDVTGQFYYPRNGWTLLGAALFWITIPSCAAAGLAFVLAAKPKPRPRTLLKTLGTALLILGGLFTLWLYLINVIDSPQLARNVHVVVIVVLLGIVALLPGLSFLRLPLVVAHDPPQSLYGPWWRAFFVVIGLLVVVTCLSVIAPDRPASMIADFAQSLGGHYYTWLNAVGPGLLSSIAIAGAAQVGLCWAKAHNELQMVQY